MAHTIYFKDGSGMIQIANDGTYYYHTNVNGRMEPAGRYVPGRPELSTISDPEGPGGVLTIRRQTGAGGGTAPPASQGGSGGTGGTGVTPAGSSAGHYPNEPGSYLGSDGKWHYGMDAQSMWQYDSTMLSSAELRRLQQRGIDEAKKAQDEYDAEREAEKAESDARYEEDKARQDKYDRENAARQQIYNVESARSQGISDIGASMPGYAPQSVESALMKWANRLGVGFNAPMPVTPDVEKFYDFLRGKGFSSGLLPKTGAVATGGTNGK